MHGVGCIQTLSVMNPACKYYLLEYQRLCIGIWLSVLCVESLYSHWLYSVYCCNTVQCAESRSIAHIHCRPQWYMHCSYCACVHDGGSFIVLVNVACRVMLNSATCCNLLLCIVSCLFSPFFPLSPSLSSSCS